MFTRARNLDRTYQVFTSQIDPRVRIPVANYIADSTTTIIAGTWVDYDGHGCLMALACKVAVEVLTGTPTTCKELNAYDDSDAKNRVIGQVLGIKPNAVRACWKAWDRATDKERTAFRAALGDWVKEQSQSATTISTDKTLMSEVEEALELIEV